MQIELTEKAARKFKEIIAKNGIPDAALRVGVSGVGCSGLTYEMRFEKSKPLPEDEVFESFGVKIYVDSASIRQIDGTKIDYIESKDCDGFAFYNPNIKPVCGCGVSFTA